MSKKAFTLIELLSAVAIVGIISAFVAIQMNNANNASKDTRRKADIQLLANAVVSYSTENYSSKPISSGCTIGGDCPNTISDSLKPFLSTLPTDPNSNSYYTYQSDGSDCTISASLSDGTTYQYSCSTKLATTGTPTSGVCGSANNSNSYTQPTSNFCSDGTIPTVSISSTGWTWSCPGAYLGASVDCVANKSIDGVCGSSSTDIANNNFETAPTTNLCFAGNNTTVIGSGSSPYTGYWSWNCNGINDGNSIACVADKKVNGACGSSNNSNSYTQPTSNFCSDGFIPTVSGSGPWTWSCPGLNLGSSASCTANKKIDADCGSANGGYFSSAPTSGLCYPGNPSTSGSWSWYCYGINGGNGKSCSATYQAPTTCGGSHTQAQCTAAGGSMTLIDKGCYLCVFSGSSCLGGFWFYTVNEHYGYFSSNAANVDLFTSSRPGCMQWGGEGNYGCRIVFTLPAYSFGYHQRILGPSCSCTCCGSCQAWYTITPTSIGCY